METSPKPLHFYKNHFISIATSKIKRGIFKKKNKKLKNVILFLAFKPCDMETTRTKSVKLRDTLLGIKNYEVYKNRKIMEIKQEREGVLEIDYNEKGKTFEGIWYLNTNKIVKTKGNIKNKQMIDILISNFLINREEKVLQTDMEKLEKQRASL